MARAKTEVVDERELKVRDRQTDIMQRVGVLTDPKTKQIVVRDQEGANLASSLVTDSEMLRAEWKLEWYGTPYQPGDIPKADALHKSLITRWRKIDTPLATIVTGCKNAINFWRVREQQKREEAARKLEVKERRKEPEFVAPRVEVEVPGMTTAELWRSQVYYCEGKNCRCTLVGKGPLREETVMKLHYRQGLYRFVKATAKNENYLDHLTENPTSLNKEAREKHAMAVKVGGELPGMEGEIFPGIQVVKIESLRRG